MTHTVALTRMHRSYRPCAHVDEPSHVPAPGVFPATPQRFPESHAAQGLARFGRIRNGPETSDATLAIPRPGDGSRFATRPDPQRRVPCPVWALRRFASGWLESRDRILRPSPVNACPISLVNWARSNILLRSPFNCTCREQDDQCRG